MSQKLFSICNIIAEREEDYKTLLEYLGNYPVSISKAFPDELYFEVPTLVIGWNFVKNKFPKQNIFDKEISQNLSWSFSKSEKEKEFYDEAESFFIQSVKKWLPNNFKLFDSYLNKESLNVFLKENLNIDKKMFVFFHDGALYINNDKNNFIINVKSLSTMHVNFREIITNILNTYQTVAFSYNNFYGYIDLDKIGNITTIDNLRWVKYGVETSESYFNIIPNFHIQKYIPFLMSKLNSIELDSEEKAFYKRMCQRDKITCWLSSREVAFVPEFDNKKLNFKLRRNCKLAKINYSNKRTITGRIAARDGYNPQNLDKKNDERKNIISRFEGGRILTFDYISFEPKISLYETKNQNFINKLENKDLHKEVALILYETLDITEERRMFSKSITNPLIYGESDNSLLIKLSNFIQPDYKLYQIKEFLKPIIEKSKEINNLVKEQGYVIIPTNSIIKPNKDFAGYNNYIQAYASEIMVDKLFEIRKLLNSYKTEFIFQVHDSMVFDLHPDEFELINKITNILSNYENMKFNLSINIGVNYKDLKSL